MNEFGTAHATDTGKSGRAAVTVTGVCPGAGTAGWTVLVTGR
jgi:hypothetical protein